MRCEQVRHSLQGKVRFTVFAESAEPLILLGEFGEPGVGGGENEQTAGIESLMDGGKKTFRIYHPVDQVAGEDEIIAGKQGFEIGGVRLLEKSRFPVPFPDRTR